MSRSSVGSYGNSHFQPEEISEFDVNTRRRLDGLGPVRPQPTPEQVKQVFEEAQREDQAQRDRFETQKNADAFVAGHPEWIDNKANGQLLLNQVNTMFGSGLHTVDHWERAYDYLRSNTEFLKLDNTVLAAQQRQAAKQRFEAAKAHTTAITFNPNANYDEMSLDEIRQRATEEHQRQLQRAGERGGNDW